MKYLISLLILLNISAESEIQYSGFLDSYFAHDTNQDGKRIRPYTTQSYYAGEPAVNLAWLSAKLIDEEYRGTLAVQYGSSVKSNYSAEPEQFFRYIQEATAGIRLGDRLWWDTGIHASHIGLESWLSKDNFTYTRSLISEYSPYYQLGTKLTYDFVDGDQMSFHILNGWQNISDDKNPAFGFYYSHILNPKTSLSYSNFIGNENGVRIFHDFVVKHKFNDVFELAGAFDLGNQESDSHHNNWHGYALILKAKNTSKLSTILRVEGYNDPHQIILSSQSGKTSEIYGASLGLDYGISSRLNWRNEVKGLYSKSEIFPKNDSFKDTDLLLVTSLGIYF